MARITDPTKLERIKKAAMEIMAEEGYSAASISNIAKKAQVSTGYLYRHYASKSELIDELIRYTVAKFEDTIFSDIENAESAEHLIVNSVKAIFGLALCDPIHAKFLSVIYFDNSDEVIEKKPRKNKETFFNNHLMVQNKKPNSTLRKNLDSDDVALILLPLIFQYVRIKLNRNDKSAFDDYHAEKLAQIIIKALS